ncbi:MAG TPA: thioredoxin domain-containing protein [Solirubrobacterales bacterium]|nr:thioredoxin domain-containing protein [Solirubrobacterales bacterium]
MNGRRDREARREERLQEEQQAGAVERRQRMVKLASAGAFLALVVVAVLIVISSGNSSGGDSSNIVEVKGVDKLLAGIPQKGMVLGDPGAKVKVLEFGDLQCPFCKGYSEEVLPQVIENRVRSGEATLEFRNFTIIGPQSRPAGAAAIAAGEQGRGWNFVELFYRNQGSEDSGYADDAFLTAIARAAGVPDLARWNRERKSQAAIAAVEATNAEAEKLGFSGTPSFALEGPGTAGLETIDTPESVDALESAIENAGE